MAGMKGYGTSCSVLRPAIIDCLCYVNVAMAALCRELKNSSLMVLSGTDYVM